MNAIPIPCNKCGALLKSYWLKDGACNACRNPDSVVKPLTTSENLSKMSPDVYECEACKDTGNDPKGNGCKECCEHGDTDNHCCLICDKDLTEDRMSAAYDHAKDFRKYGE